MNIIAQKILDLNFYDIYSILKYKQPQDLKITYSYHIETLKDCKVKIISVVRISDLNLKKKLETKEITSIEIARITNQCIIQCKEDDFTLNESIKSNELKEEPLKLIIKNEVISIKTMLKIILMLCSFNINDIIIDVN